MPFFKINAEQDLSFLKNGIYDMLTSRLSQPGEVTVLGREVTAEALKVTEGPLNPDGAVDLGRELGADKGRFSATSGVVLIGYVFPHESPRARSVTALS